MSHPDWLQEHFSRLTSGQMTQWRPAEAFAGKLTPNQLVTFAPVTGSLAQGDLVACTCDDVAFLQVVTADMGDGTYLVTDDTGAVRSTCDILGVAILIQD